MFLYDNWDLVENDLHQTYGIDMDDPLILNGRTWAWVLKRADGLFSTTSRISTLHQATIK